MPKANEEARQRGLAILSDLEGGEQQVPIQPSKQDPETAVKSGFAALGFAPDDLVSPDTGPSLFDKYFNEALRPLDDITDPQERARAVQIRKRTWARLKDNVPVEERGPLIRGFQAGGTLGDGCEIG